MAKPKKEITIMLWLVAAVTLFHFSILLKIVPCDITWGGRLKNDSEMYIFESVSITINIILAVTLLIKGSYIRNIISIRVVNGVLWAFLVIFILNTIGNFLAETSFEKLFAILTLVFSFLIWKILKAGRGES